MSSSYGAINVISKGKKIAEIKFNVTEENFDSIDFAKVKSPVFK